MRVPLLDRLRLLVPLLLCAAAVSAYAMPTYHFTDLGALPGGTDSYGVAINASGTVVGQGNINAQGHTRGFVASGGSLQVLPSFGGAYGEASDINDAGVVVGSSLGPLGFRPFRTVGNQIQSLGGFGGNGAAYAINNLNQIVGTSQDIDGYIHAFRYDANGMVNLDPANRFGSRASDINDSGRIVGSRDHINNWTSEAVLWYQGTATVLASLAVVPDANFGASAINANNQIVGSSCIGLVYLDCHAVLWSDPHTILDLGTLGGRSSGAGDINIFGQIVGSSSFADDPEHLTQSHAFLYQDGAMHDLNDLLAEVLPEGAYLSSAAGINDAGWITGTYLPTGQWGASHAYLLTPVLDGSVPEPGSAALALIAGAALLASRRQPRRRKMACA